MKITLNKTEEIELTEREESIYDKGMVKGFWLGYIIAAVLAVVVFASSCNAQISAQIRTGYATKTNEPFISGAINFGAHNLAVAPELIVNYKDNSPAHFGVKFSYEHKVWLGSLKAGYGRYFDLYSTDYYDKYKNGWSNTWFVSAHYRILFVEADTNGRYSFGMRETISKLQ